MWFWVLVAIGIIGVSLFGEPEARPIEGDWDMVNNAPERVIAIIDKQIAAEKISMSKYGKLKINS